MYQIGIIPRGESRTGSDSGKGGEIPIQGKTDALKPWSGVKDLCAGIAGPQFLKN
jgi:hypothetical protein